MDKHQGFIEKLDILKSEMTIIYAHLQHLRSLIWNVKQICVTLWLISVGVGLGVFTSGIKPNIIILSISVMLPVWFLSMESIYSAQYRQHLMRLREIQKFIQLKRYQLPGTKDSLSFDKSLETGDFKNFPIPDFTGEATFKSDNTYYWITSKLRRSIGGNRIIFYGGLSTLSSAFLAIQLSEMYGSFWFFLIGLAGPSWILVLWISASVSKKRIFSGAVQRYDRWWGS